MKSVCQEPKGTQWRCLPFLLCDLCSLSQQMQGEELKSIWKLVYSHVLLRFIPAINWGPPFLSTSFSPCCLFMWMSLDFTSLEFQGFFSCLNEVMSFWGEDDRG